MLFCAYSKYYRYVCDKLIQSLSPKPRYLANCGLILEKVKLVPKIIYLILRFAASSAIKQFDNTRDANYSKTQYQKLLDPPYGSTIWHPPNSHANAPLTYQNLKIRILSRVADGPDRKINEFMYIRDQRPTLNTQTFSWPLAPGG